MSHTNARYSHVFSIAFAVESDHEAEDVTITELWAGIENRLRDLPYDEIFEAAQLEDSEALG
jgi:hypothetical protein